MSHTKDKLQSQDLNSSWQYVHTFHLTYINQDVVWPIGKAKRKTIPLLELHKQTKSSYVTMARHGLWADKYMRTSHVKKQYSINLWMSTYLPETIAYCKISWMPTGDIRSFTSTLTSEVWNFHWLCPLHYLSKTLFIMQIIFSWESLCFLFGKLHFFRVCFITHHHRAWAHSH